MKPCNYYVFHLKFKANLQVYFYLVVKKQYVSTFPFLYRNYRTYCVY